MRQPGFGIDPVRHAEQSPACRADAHAKVFGMPKPAAPVRMFDMPNTSLSDQRGSDRVPIPSSFVWKDAAL
jgi:hypothetical protein